MEVRRLDLARCIRTHRSSIRTRGSGPGPGQGPRSGLQVGNGISTDGRSFRADLKTGRHIDVLKFVINREGIT